MGQLLCTFLRNGEIPLFKVSEQITAAQLLHDDVDVVLILEDIKKANDVRMLAHLENLDFPSLQLDVLNRHLLLAHDLDCDTLASLLVGSRFDQPEFTFPKRLFDLVVVEKVAVADCLFDGSHPLVLVFLFQQVVGSWLISWENQCERVKNSRTVEVFLRIIFEEDSTKIMHAFVLLLILVLVHIELITKQTVPVFLELSLGGFPNHLTFELDILLLLGNECAHGR